MLLVACDEHSAPATQSAGPVSGEWHEFTGSWTASGTRRTLRLDDDHHAAIFDLSGSLLLTGAQRPAVGFKAEVIGFSDSRLGMLGRCIWTDEHGEMIFSELRGEWVGDGRHITGTFTGGTGRWSDITGEFTFQWQYVVEAEDGGVSGRVVDLHGRARLNDNPTAPGDGR